MVDLCQEILMRELIDQLNKLTEALDADSQEVADISKKYGFGSTAWQDAMIARIKRKLAAKQELSGIDTTFIETQVMHDKKLMDELKSMGAEGIGIN
jgi:hypothetical protein